MLSSRKAGDLEEAIREVERALREFVRRAKARRILELAGSGLWEGDLSVVREDRGVYRTRRRDAR